MAASAISDPVIIKSRNWGVETKSSRCARTDRTITGTPRRAVRRLKVARRDRCDGRNFRMVRTKGPDLLIHKP